MKGTYRVNQEIHGTVAGVEHRTFVTIPEGSIISLIGPVVEEPEYVDVLCDGQTVRMFACDFTARTTAITAKESKATADEPVKVRRFTASGREL